MNYAMDAGALIAFLDDEPGADAVEEVLTEPDSSCFAHVYNLAEVYHIYYRRGGAAMAEEALSSLDEAGIVLRDDHDEPYWKEAAAYKGRHAMALPDCFCLALGRRLDGQVVTADHGEFDPLVPLGYCDIRFIR